MDDDRPIQPNDPRRRPADRASDGAPPGAANRDELEAFLDRVRPRAGRLLRLATIAAGDPGTAERAAAAAVRSTWRDARRLDPTHLDPDDLAGALEIRLAAAVPRRRSATAGTPLDLALAPLKPADRIALARCLDPVPDEAALRVAGRAGVEFAALAGGAIVDLDGPLVGWDLQRLRASLAAATGPLDADRLVARAAAELAGTRPDHGWMAALREILPGPAVAARGIALVLAVVVGASTLALTASRPDAAGGVAGSTAGTEGPAAGTGDGSSGVGGVVAGMAIDTPGEFPAEVDGLPVLGVKAAKRLVGDPSARGRAIAIRGWLVPPTLRDACATGLPSSRTIRDPLSPEAAFCLREAVLREAPVDRWSVTHLHAQLRPGTGLGHVARALAAADGSAIPVVVVAHYGDPLAALCTAGGRQCGEALVVDGIAWAVGAPTRPATAVRPTVPGTETRRSADDAIAIAEEAFAGLRVLAVSGLPTAELGRVEPAAVDVAPPSGFAWLVRALADVRPGDEREAVGTWLVVDDGTGEIVAAPDAAAGRTGTPGSGYLFPKRVDGALVRSVAELRELAADGMPEGAAIAVAGWLATPTLAGACVPEVGLVDGPLGRDAAFCRRAATLRGSGADGRVVDVQLPPGTPSLPIDEAIVARDMPVPVVALVVSGSPRSEPCLPGRVVCTRELVLERLLWVAGTPTDVAVATLDVVGSAPPRLATADVRTLAESAIAGHGRIVSIVRVPAARRSDVAPGANASPIAGDHAWIVRVRSPMADAATGRGSSLDLLWWLMVDDATGRTSTGMRSLADLPGRLARVAPA
jgi:hypothetical protein